MPNLGRINLDAPMELQDADKRLGTVYESAMAFIQSQGLQMPNRPSSNADLPESLTALDDEQLGDLLNRVSTYVGFVEFELEKARIQRNSAKEKLDFVKARVRLSINAETVGKKVTVSDKNDIMQASPLVVEATSEMLYCEAVYRLTEAIREQAQRNWDTVSRRITQRGQQVDRMRREGNLGNVPIQSRTFNRPQP